VAPRSTSPKHITTESRIGVACICCCKKHTTHLRTARRTLSNDANRNKHFHFVCLFASFVIGAGTALAL
jgi:hypothetical protein